MDISFILDGSEQFSTKVGQIDSELYCIWSSEKKWLENHRKYCIKFQKTHTQTQTGAYAML